MAEDSKAQRRIYASYLQADFEVLLFDHGRALFDAVGERLPDLVVSDLEMPEMDGLELTRRLKADPATRPLPVILLTAGDGRSVSSCLDAGADDFLRKPVQADELAARARCCVRAFCTYKELQAHHHELRATHARLIQAEERTRASEARLSAILEGAHDAILTVDPSGRIASMNRASERMFGWTRAEVGRLLFVDLLSPGIGRTGVADQLQRLPAGIADRREAIGRRLSGEEFPVEIALTSVDTAEGPVVCAFLRDLSVSRQMEAALRQVQQLEAISRMAGGIAHEINTPVQCIQDSLEFLRQVFDDVPNLVARYRELAAAAEATHPDPVAAAREAESAMDLDYVLESATPAARRGLEMGRRIVEIVRATKEFAGPEGGRAATVELHSTLRTVLDITRPVYAEVAEVELSGEPVFVAGHAGELNEAFRQLVVNAAQAIADTGRRGTIRVHTVREGEDALVTVRDDGCGIGADVGARVFDPFFTTKEVGRGVGLGLFVANAAARRHDGSLTFESEPGKGATFCLRLPAKRGAAMAR